MSKMHREAISVMILLLILAVPAGYSIADPGGSLEVSLSNADLTFEGEDNGDWAAYSASPAGDVNGDGWGDILIGAPLAGNKVPGDFPKGEGKAYLILGRPKVRWPANPINLSQADASFLGCFVESMTGRQNYTAGDVNGDGYDDFLISGWKCGPVYRGKAYLFLGRPYANWGTDFPVEGADASFLGEVDRDKLSYYVSTAGDVNGDGFDDFLLASPHNSEVGYKAGQVYLFLGRPDADWGVDYPVGLADASFLAEAENDRAGRSVAGVGDVNGDGFDDFFIGAIFNDEGGTDAGQSYLILGRPEADWGMDYPLSLADASFIGEAAGDESGRRVAGAGDVNGDGYSDLLVGASRNAEAGIEAGKAYLILGRPGADWGMDYSLALAEASFLGEALWDQAGRRVSGAGDANGDTYDDFLIGAPHNSRGGLWAGTAYLIYGRPAADWGTSFPLSNADVAYVGKADVLSAGYDVAPLGDVDGDAVDDFLIGAFGGRMQAEVPGEAYVLFGDDGPVPLQFNPDAPQGQVREWHSFTGHYSDPSGWQDIARAQMILGRTPTDRSALDVTYDADENAFYLRDPVGAGWHGPCSPGEPVILSNGIVQLACHGIAVANDGDRELQLTWRARWVQQTDIPRELRAHLRAIDQSKDDSGFVELGTWTLLPKTN